MTARDTGTSEKGPDVSIQRISKASGIPSAAFFRDCAGRVLGTRAGELVIRIVDEAESAELNERYRGKSGPTNVLAFPADDIGVPGINMAEIGAVPLGDLVICAAVVAREAREQGKEPKAHWAHMVIHGCLHLTGYDHMNESEAAAMEARERELLAGLGIADPYVVP